MTNFKAGVSLEIVEYIAASIFEIILWCMQKYSFNNGMEMTQRIHF